MPVYHIVLFRLKPAVSPEQLSKFSAAAKGMVGKIPGLLELNSGPPLAVTAHRARGFDMGIVAVLEKPGDVEPYGTHPAHQEVHKMREALCDETLAFDMEF